MIPSRKKWQKRTKMCKSFRFQRINGKQIHQKDSLASENCWWISAERQKKTHSCFALNQKTDVIIWSNQPSFECHFEKPKKKILWFCLKCHSMNNDWLQLSVSFPYWIYKALCARSLKIVALDTNKMSAIVCSWRNTKDVYNQKSCERINVLALNNASVELVVETM